MPSFLIRGLAHYLAASAMESRARRQSSFSPSPRASSDDNKKLSDADLAGWEIHMRWLIPLVQATGYQIVIDNPKSHEQIIIDQNTKDLPELTLEWMQKYNKQELLEWMEKEKERQQQEEKERQKILEARRIEEARGRARFGNSFTLGEQRAQPIKHKSQKVSKSNYWMPILCLLYVSIIVLIGLWIYNSSFFDTERHEKDVQKYYALMDEAANSPITEIVTPEGFMFGMNEKEFNALNEQRESYVVDNYYSTRYDWLLGNVHYTGFKINTKLFHDGQLCSYDITITGRMIDENYYQLTEADVNNICNYYKVFLDKDYTFAKLSDLEWGGRGKTFVFTKNNMAITLRYNNPYEDNTLWIKCENRPIIVSFPSVQNVKEDISLNLEDMIEDSQTQSIEDSQTQSYAFSSDSTWISVFPLGCSTFKMIKVEGGVFTMGNNNGFNTKPEHQVELSDFYIAEKEITQALWYEIMGTNGSGFAKRLQSPQKPADDISWYDALKFIEELNSLTDLQFRLPTEAEWEFAAKGGNRSRGYTYSGSDDINQVAWWAGNAYNVKPLGPDYGTHYVGKKTPNELGLYDMSGNVREWCQDWYNDYPRKKQKNPTGPTTGCAKVVRGGCFKSGSSCKNVYRDYQLPDNSSFVGVRLALSINKDN